MMNIILLSNFCEKHGSVGICLSKIALWFIPVMIILTGSLFWLGYQSGLADTAQKQTEMALAELHAMVRRDRQVIADAQAAQRAHLDALALRLALLQARIMRVDALGERLVGIGELDQEEFDFSIEPPVGGVASATDESQEVAEITAGLQYASQLLEDREAKLQMLETQLLNSELIHETLPSGRPVEKGWFSSNYGMRTDPFSGKKSFHKGVDFAGPRGTDIYSVAAGVVERSAEIGGFGNVVKIRHADGYSTLYAHNQKNLVQKGDVVKKGQVIALLGSTGRSSGPHVHFEVRKNGRPVNPRDYIHSP
jgi:murein DD-endopeptidase MepM/ murein hydrolase activator NlpD